MGWKFTLGIIFFSLLSMILLAASGEAGRVRLRCRAPPTRTRLLNEQR